MIEARTRALTIIIVAMIAVVIALGLGGWLFMRSFVDDAKTWSDVTAPVIRKANDDAVVLIETKIPGEACAAGCEGTGFSIAPVSRPELLTETIEWLRRTRCGPLFWSCPRVSSGCSAPTSSAGSYAVIRRAP